MIETITLLAFIQLFVIIYLIVDRQKRRKGITTNSIKIGGYVIKIVDGNITTEPIK
jgi:hypothetical protein